MKEILNFIKEIIPKDLSNVRAVVGDSKYKGLTVDKKNFHELNKKSYFNQVVFVDGGNAELFNNNSFSIQKLRIYSCVYSGKKKIFFQRKDYDSLSYIQFNKELAYFFETFPNSISLKINPNDPQLKFGVNRAPLSLTADIARRFLELEEARTMCERFPNSLIVLDGSLKPNYPNEEKFLNKLFKSAEENGCSVCSVVKTTNTLTNKLLPLTYVLDKKSNKELWFYFPIIENNNKEHKAEILFAKLNKKSKFVFKIEIYEGNINLMKEIISTLAYYSADVSFPGYPYGLIDADRFARISNDEKNVLRLKLSHIIPKHLRISENNNLAHDLLNKLINR